MSTSNFENELAASRKRLLSTIDGATDVTFIRLFGNIGDELIYAGARRLLASTHYREVSIRQLTGARGETAILAGCGGWCHAFHEMPALLRETERRFDRVIVFPSSFDTTEPSVRKALAESRATFFARERYSYEQIEKFCDAHLAFDTAFFFEFAPYCALAQGSLSAFRTDRESSTCSFPLNNDDISLTCETMDEWLWRIACCQTVQTDRAHVTIAAAMLGKRVRYQPSNYHKLTGIVEYALSGFDVQRLNDNEMSSGVLQARIATGSEVNWGDRILRSSREIAAIVPSGSRFILVDDDRLGTLPVGDRRSIPFLERGGFFWGPPSDSRTAIRELERLCEAEPACIIFAWPAFWWFDYYPELLTYLRERCRCLIDNDHLVGFALDSRVQRGEGDNDSSRRDVLTIST